MEIWIRGDRLGTERAFHINGINKQFPWIRSNNKHFPWICASNKPFPWIPLDYKRWSSEKIDSVVREFSVQLWSVNQQTPEAE
jgi:hypothetical protein